MKKKRMRAWALGAMATLMLASCGTTQTVPLTGRTHRISVSDAQVLSLSNQEYTKYMASAKKSTNAVKTAQVERVGKRLAAASTLPRMLVPTCWFCAFDICSALCLATACAISCPRTMASELSLEATGRSPSQTTMN